MKNSLTPAGIETATFRFLVQHLNRCATAVPPPLEKQGFNANIPDALIIPHWSESDLATSPVGLL